MGGFGPNDEAEGPAPRRHARPPLATSRRQDGSLPDPAPDAAESSAWAGMRDGDVSAETWMREWTWTRDGDGSGDGHRHGRAARLQLSRRAQR